MKYQIYYTDAIPNSPACLSSIFHINEFCSIKAGEKFLEKLGYAKKNGFYILSPYKLYYFVQKNGQHPFKKESISVENSV